MKTRSSNVNLNTKITLIILLHHQEHIFMSFKNSLLIAACTLFNAPALFSMQMYNQLIEDPREYVEEKKNTQPSFSLSFINLADLPINPPSRVTPRCCPCSQKTPFRSVFMLNEFINTRKFPSALTLILNPEEDVHSYSPTIAAFEVLRHGNITPENTQKWQNYHQQPLCPEQFHHFLLFLNEHHEVHTVEKIIANKRHPLSPYYPIQSIKRYRNKAIQETKTFEEIYKKFQCLINLGEYKAALTVIKNHDLNEKFRKHPIVSCVYDININGSIENCPHLSNQKNWNCFNTGPINKTSFLNFLQFLSNKKKCTARTLKQARQYNSICSTLEQISQTTVDDITLK